MDAAVPTGRGGTFVSAAGPVDHANLFSAAMDALRGRGNTKPALTRLAVFSPGFASVYLAWGDRAGREGFTEFGLTLLKRATAITSNDQRAHLGLANLEYGRAQMNSAHRHVSRALLLAPGQVGGYRILTSIVLRKRRHEAAVQAFKWSRCIATPRSQDILIVVWALFELDRLVECARAVNGYLLAKPNDPLGNKLWSRVLARQEKLSTAARQVRRIETLKPDDPDVFLAMGRIAMARRRYRDATRGLRRAVILEPRNYSCTFDLARAQWASEEFIDAEKLLAWLCRTDPGYETRSQVLRFSATGRDFRLPFVTARSQE
jgi:predicted Zn-dependent protease